MARKGMANGPRQRGFTLLELLAVLVLVMLVMTLVPPLLSGAIPGARLKGAAHDLTATLRNTRKQSITRNAELVVRLSPEQAEYRVGRGRPTTLPDGVRLNVQGLVDTGLPSNEPHLLWFFPDGSSSGARIQLVDDKGGYRLDVDWLTGRVELGEVIRVGS